MDFLPVFLDIRRRNTVVIGGGDVAARKVDLMLRAGARVDVVSPELCASLQRKADDGQIRYTARPYAEGDLSGARLVVAATDNEEVNRQVARDAEGLGIPVNVADNPEIGSYIVPSIVDRSPVLVAVSTGGASPVLARLIPE